MAAFSSPAGETPGQTGPAKLDICSLPLKRGVASSGPDRMRFAVFLLITCAVLLPAAERRIYPDDPLRAIPAPLRVDKVKRRKLNEYYDYFQNTFSDPGLPGRDVEAQDVPAGDVNTLGEVLDSSWFTNRHGRSRMSREELIRGPGNATAPDTSQPWLVTAAKTEGVTPGLTIQDARKRRYILKFDPPSYPEMATAVDVVGSKFYHAIGYNTPQNYIVVFSKDQLRVGPEARLTDERGIERPMRDSDIQDVLRRVGRTKEGQFRGMASLYLPGEPVGPFKFYGTRRDDPNDVVRHESRRDLRGLRVFNAWLNHTDAKSINSLDMLVDDGPLRYVRHHLIDFGAILGSDSLIEKSVRNGNVYLFDWRSSAKAFFSLGLYIPHWYHSEFNDLPAVGNLDWKTFAPEEWRPNYPNPAFRNLLPDDAFWAAKIVMAFRDDEIRDLVSTGQYSQAEAVNWISKALVERRNRIGQVYFDRVLPLEQFRLEGNQLTFEDLAVTHRFRAARPYQVEWHPVDPSTGQWGGVAGSGMAIPDSLRQAGSGYYGAILSSTDAPGRTVRLIWRASPSGQALVGVQRTWTQGLPKI